MNLELHPLCTLFPRLSGAEFDALRNDIKANGLRQPIVLHDSAICATQRQSALTGERFSVIRLSAQQAGVWRVE